MEILSVKKPPADLYLPFLLRVKSSLKILCSPSFPLFYDAKLLSIWLFIFFQINTVSKFRRQKEKVWRRKLRKSLNFPCESEHPFPQNNLNCFSYRWNDNWVWTLWHKGNQISICGANWCKYSCTYHRVIDGLHYSWLVLGKTLTTYPYHSYLFDFSMAK